MEELYYITAPISPQYEQMTLEEFLFGEFTAPRERPTGIAGTKTWRTPQISPRLSAKVDVPKLIRALDNFNASVPDLHRDDMHGFYRTFYIPKHSGGMRRIDAPNPELMNALRKLKLLLETEFHASYHTAAYAYVKKRSHVHALKRHQANESRWFAKLDLSNFFGSTTLPFVMQMLSRIFPFSEVCRDDHGRLALQDALSLGFLDGVLPQGTPLSPMLTNLMMIPVDFTLTKTLRDFENQRFIYTRYADDFLISSRYDFDVHKIEALVVSTLAGFQAPFSINQTKTRYGSSAGRNWNLGLMLNKDNQITVGYKKKRQLKSMLHNFVMSQRDGAPWPLEELQYVLGVYSYIRSVEPEATDRMVSHLSQEHHTDDIIKLMKQALKSA